MISAKEMRDITNRKIEEINCEDIIDFVSGMMQTQAKNGNFSCCINFSLARANNFGNVTCSKELDLSVEKAVRVIKENGYSVLETKGLYTYVVSW